MFSRYLVASVVALAVDIGVLYLLLLAYGVTAGSAAVGGYLAGVVVHYWASRHFVFSAGWLNDVRWAEFGAFIASGLAGLALTFGIVHILVERLGLPVLVGKGAAVTVSLVVVYLLRASLVFRRGL